jgi:glycogen debranching enzyme
MTIAMNKSVVSVPDQFYIPAAASMQERRPRALKHGDTFAMFDPNGNILPNQGAAEGIYHCDTRHLSHLNLLLGGKPLMLLSSTVRDDNVALTCDLTNPDLQENGVIVLEHDQIHVRRSIFLWQEACYERIAVRSYSDAPQRLQLELRFGTDFADVFEVRGQHRPHRGRMHPPEREADGVKLSYTGLDGTTRVTRLRFDPKPDVLGDDRALFTLDLQPKTRQLIHLEIACNDRPSGRPLREAFYLAVRDARRAVRRMTSRVAAVTTSNDIFNECTRRSVFDLYMLVTDTPHGAYPYAGIPWYATAFGRDGIITALLMLWMDPSIARGVLLFLAANQATTTDPGSDAEPGKILHELRHGEMAELGEVPFRRYYGSVDATPLFVMLAGAYLQRTGDIETIRRLWPHIEAALSWIDLRGDRDGDGFVEYYRMTETGLANQGWKDSYDSVFHANGEMPKGPIALVEVQGYVYRARRAAARIAERLGLIERAAALRAQAEELRDRIEEVFWCEDLGTYALALDGEKRPCRVRSSNAGHLLLAGVPAPWRARRVAAQLLGSDFFSGWGIRTIASTEARYNPMSYHNGSVWPHDNALIGLGLARYGFRYEAARLLEGLFDATAHIDLRRLPELICGFPRRRGQGPTFYPVACAPQAWSSTATSSLLAACLGISFDAVTRTVRFDRPVLPGFTDSVEMRGLALGGGEIDVAIRGRGEEVAVSVLARRGDIRATVTS